MTWNSLIFLASFEVGVVQIDKLNDKQLGSQAGKLPKKLTLTAKAHNYHGGKGDKKNFAFGQLDPHFISKPIFRANMICAIVKSGLSGPLRDGETKKILNKYVKQTTTYLDNRNLKIPPFCLKPCFSVRKRFRNSNSYICGANPEMFFFNGIISPIRRLIYMYIYITITYCNHNYKAIFKRGFMTF